MVRDLWEFMNREVRARVIFGAVITGVILLIAVPYFANVLTKKSNSEVITAADTQSEEVTDSAEPAETAAETTPTPAESESTAAEPEEATTPAETASSYAYYQGTDSRAGSTASANTAAAPAASQPTANATETASQNAAPKVDDRMSGSSDDGYTASGVDSPGADETAWVADEN